MSCSELEYARLAFEPGEAMINIFLALSSNSGSVSRNDFVNFVQSCGALDKKQITREDLNAAIVTLVDEPSNISQVQIHNDPGAGLNFKNFKRAMVKYSRLCCKNG